MTSPNKNGKTTPTTPTTPTTQPTLFAFSDTPAGQADVSDMGGGGVPFMPKDSMINLAFDIHNVEFHDTVHGRFSDGPMWFVYFQWHDSPNKQLYCASFSVKSPVAGQLQAFETAGDSILRHLPMGPVTLVRQFKSYRLSSYPAPKEPESTF